MSEKRKQNLHLALQRTRCKHTEDEQGIIYNYMLFEDVLRHCEKFKHWGPVRLYPQSYNLKGVITWSSTKDSDPVSAFYTSMVDETGFLI